MKTISKFARVQFTFDYQTRFRTKDSRFKRSNIVFKNGRDSIFLFLYNQFVPPDNNSSERAIRNIRVKTKVSTYFRRLVGANRFAVIGSVIDTAIKNNQRIFNALFIIVNSWLCIFTLQKIMSA